MNIVSSKIGTYKPHVKRDIFRASLTLQPSQGQPRRHKCRNQSTEVEMLMPETSDGLTLLILCFVLPRDDEDDCGCSLDCQTTTTLLKIQLWRPLLVTAQLLIGPGLSHPNQVQRLPADLRMHEPALRDRAHSVDCFYGIS
jgi:hypothetical protein